MNNPVKVYRLVVCVLDFENMGLDGVIAELENVKYSCPSVHEAQEAMVDWDDDHPLNKEDTANASFKKLFKGVPVIKYHE